LEVGCGTGYIALNAALVARTVVASDISFDAVINTRRNAVLNQLDGVCQIVQSDLLASFGTDDRFSVISFNPPYLPADNEQSVMDPAVIGGQTGTETAERFIREAVHHLTNPGSVYVVVSSLAQSRRVKSTMSEHSMRVEGLKSSSFFFERISVLRGSASDPKEIVL
jgi:release factor glutamine methyltransferase